MTVWQEKIAGVLQKFTSVSEKILETTRSKFSEFNEENFTISKLTNYILFLKKHTVFGLEKRLKYQTAVRETRNYVRTTQAT